MWAVITERCVGCAGYAAGWTVGKMCRMVPKALGPHSTASPRRPWK